jgi:hypothetical protein
MSWDLILQLAALVLLGGIAAIIGMALWSFATETKHKRNLELIQHRERMNRQLNRELDELGRTDDA